MKKRIIKIIIAIILYVFSIVVKFDNIWINNAIFILSYIIVGYEILKKALRNVFRGKIFDENFLMVIAILL